MAAAKKSAESAPPESDEKATGLYVSAPIVVVKTKGNRVVHLYKGDLVLDDVSEESLKNLQDLGYVSDEPQQ